VKIRSASRGSRDQQITIIAALTEGMSIRSTERLTGVHRDTIMRLGARVGAGCQTNHVWTIGELIEKSPANVPDTLGRRRKPVTLTVIDGGKE
jgi:hypothetical protein